GDAPFELEYPVDDRPKPHQPDGGWKREGAHVDFFADPDLLPRRWGVNVFVALTKMPTRGGAFMVAPGSPLRFAALASRRPSEYAWTAAIREFGDGLVEFLPEPG